MKRKKMLDFISLADEKYIEEADPSIKRSPKITRKLQWGNLVACLCCALLVLNLVVFVPILSRLNDSTIDSTPNSTPVGSIPNVDSIPDTTPNVDSSPSTTPNSKPVDSTPTIDSETVDSTTGGNDVKPIVPSKNQALIDALNGYYNKDLDYTFPERDIVTNDKFEQDAEEGKNNEMGDLSEKIQDSLEEGDSNDIADNQVFGISEGDIIKKTDTHIYYLKDSSICVYSIDGQSSKLVSMLNLESYISDAFLYVFNLTKYQKLNDSPDFIIDGEFTSSSWEIYITSDDSTLILVANSLDIATCIFTFDISTAPTVKLSGYNIIAGKYISSRLTNDELIVFTSYYVQKKFDDNIVTTYTPFEIKNADRDATVKVSENIFIPEKLSSSSYMTITRLNGKTLETTTALSSLSFTSYIYVSNDNIYLTREFGTEEGFRNTEILRIAYKDGVLQPCGSAVINGYLLNQYSLDEYNGILRAVTTTDGYVKDNKIVDSTNASLFCIDINTMTVRNKVEGFAPAGEEVLSVRFDKIYAYVCTAEIITFSDPVFIFNLEDIDNITYTDTGTIEGYSTTLINYGDGIVIGIGVEDDNTLKIECYKEASDGSVKALCTYTSQNTFYFRSIKSYYIDRSRGLLGLVTRTYNRTESKYETNYLLLRFNGESFDVILNQALDFQALSTGRGFYQDRYFYIISYNSFMAINVGTISKIN